MLNSFLYFIFQALNSLDKKLFERQTFPEIIILLPFKVCIFTFFFLIFSIEAVSESLGIKILFGVVKIVSKYDRISSYINEAKQ